MMDIAEMTNMSELSVETIAAEDPYLRYLLDPSSAQIRVFTLLPSSDPQAPLRGRLRVEDLKLKATKRYHTSGVLLNSSSSCLLKVF